MLLTAAFTLKTLPHVNSPWLQVARAGSPPSQPALSSLIHPLASTTNGVTDWPVQSLDKKSCSPKVRVPSAGLVGLVGLSDTKE